MRCIVPSLMAALLVLGGSLNEAGAQCPVVNEVSPAVIGRTINPASIYFSFNGDVNDAEVITFDTAGVNVTFEFDTNTSVVLGNNPVIIPPPPGNRDAAREAFITAVNDEPSSPVTVSSDFSDEFPQYMAVVWKGEADGYGATNSTTGANIQVLTLTHHGEARSYILLTGSDLSQVTAVNLNSTTSAEVLPGTILEKSTTTLGFRVTVVPTGSDPTSSVAPLGDYDIELISPCGSTVTVPAAVEVVENLLNDSTFSMNLIGNTIHSQCASPDDTWPGPLWEHHNTPGAPISQWDFRERSDFFREGCERNDPFDGVDDFIWGSLTSDQVGRHEFWQTIPVDYVQPTTVSLSGLLGGGSGGSMNYGVELQSQNGTVIAESVNPSSGGFIPPSSGNSFWSDFALTGEFPAGTTEIKAVFFMELASNSGAAVHFDDLLLFEGELCANPPGITAINPDFGERDDNSAAVTIDGSNFVDGDTTVKLFKGSSELLPVSMTVGSNQINATFDLTGAGRDYWSVSVENPGCPPATLNNAFNVVLAGPGLTNGSFELPEDLSQLDCNFGTETPDGPTDWTSIHVSPHGGGEHKRKNLLYPASPTCPPPDGNFWASTEGPFASAAGKRLLTQTVTATPGTYTLSGFFAAFGPNNVAVSLRDGGYQDAAVATQTVFASGDHDWTFGYVTGDVTGGIVTAEWATDLDATGTKVAHADDLILEECTVPVTATAIDPTTGPSEEVLSGVTLTGSGFSVGAPLVALVRPGTTILATHVNVTSDTTLTADFDLSGAGFGAMDVIVGNNGCYATLADGFFTAPGDLLNGEFEEPVVLIEDPVNPGEFMVDPPCDGALEGEVDFWEVSDSGKFRRDGTVLADALTCPNPNAAGGHFASMSTDQAETLQAWQVIKVEPGRNYGVSGWFAGGGEATVTLRLVDGADPGGDEIGSEVAMQTVGAQQIDWQQGTVEGTPTQEFMTVIWELTGAGGIAASHADGLNLIPPLPCPDPFADADEDGDVDQADFALFQLCISGNGNPYPSGVGFAFCACFDREGAGGPDGDVDQGDFTLFDACTSGPAIPADPSCDN